MSDQVLEKVAENRPFVQNALLHIIYVCLGGLLIFGVLSFFLTPQYERGISAALEGFKDTLLVALGVKGGLAVPPGGKVSGTNNAEPHE